MTAEALVIDERETPEHALPGTALLETIRAARAGDSAAFDEIMMVTERRVAQIAWRILGDREEVKDAMQETFLRLYRHLGRYNEQHDFLAWLSRIAVNASVDLHRRRKRRQTLQPLDESAAAVSKERPADDDLIRRAEVDLLRRAIDMLAPRERAAVLLHDVEGMRTADVAASLGNTVATVRVQLSRARVKLRRLVHSLAGGNKP